MTREYSLDNGASWHVAPFGEAIRVEEGQEILTRVQPEPLQSLTAGGAVPDGPLAYITARGAVYGGRGREERGGRNLFLGRTAFSLPDIQSVDGYKTDYNKGWSSGWNACREKVAEMNFALAAAPLPPQVQPSEALDKARLDWLEQNTATLSRMFDDSGYILSANKRAIRTDKSARAAIDFAMGRSAQPSVAQAVATPNKQVFENIEQLNSVQAVADTTGEVKS